MSHTVRTSVVTSATGEITGYGLSIEAMTTGEPEEITAAIRVSLDMIRAIIATQIANDGDGNSQRRESAQGVNDQANTPPAQSQPPATPAEARQRFFARYGEIIGGQDWADVQRYLRRPRATEPSSVEQWIASAEAVRDLSRAEGRDRSRQPVTPAAPARRQYARH